VTPTSYLLDVTEPALLTEVFLPKKAEFQGPLYDALTHGLRLEHVRRHFLDADDRRRAEIRTFLEKGWTASTPDWTDDEIRRLQRVFFGYSLYEVDGVFLKRRPHAAGTADSDDQYLIAEEQTQVLRIIFPFPTSGRSLKAIDFCRAEMRDPLSDQGPFLTRHPHLAPLLDDEVREALEDLNRWTREVGLFVFGYLLFEICGAIEQTTRGADPQRNRAELLQDEIWVSSLWNLGVNAIRRR
jgi:hypothetical protein